MTNIRSIPLALAIGVVSSGPAFSQAGERARSTLDFEGTPPSGQLEEGNHEGEQGLDPAIRARAAETRRFVSDYLRGWSHLRSIALSDVRSIYAPLVQFYGQAMTPIDLLQEKRAFLERWPMRAYAALPETMSLGCRSDAGECRVSMRYAYRTVNPTRGQARNGVATLKLVINYTQGYPQIVAESGGEPRRR